MTSDVLSVGRLLDGRYRFRLACFQRAYAWRPENVARLLTDLRWAMQQEKRKRFYPLGRVMLAQVPGSSDVEIVDGHQRMVTLTMLFAVLRDLETDPERSARLHRLIIDDAWPEHDPRRSLLTIQAIPARLFAEAVQKRGSTELEPDWPREALSETERNIVDNRDCIRSELLAPGMTDDVRRALAEYVLDHCRLVTVVVDNADDAWDMLNTEQNTRLAFSHADEAKSLILSAMPAASHVSAAHLWESCESMLAPEDMFRLLCHIRAMTWRGKYQSVRPVEIEIVERFGVSTDGLSFMADHLVPYANILKDVRRGQVGHTSIERDAAAQSIEFMTWIDAHSWMPAMLLWMKTHGAAAAGTLEFLRRLDRLVWMSKIAGVDPGVQETRLHRLLDEIAAGTPPESMNRLFIEAKVRSDAIYNLRSANFAAKHYAGVLLRRLSASLGCDPGPILRDEVTIEHILPRNPQGCKAWLTAFRNPEGCRVHHQKLGNVVLLSGRDNQKAGTLSWDEKRQILLQSPFVLAQDAAKETVWTAQTIARRTEHLINVLLASFQMPPLVKGE
ncbi:MAG: DUF262 domain-containing protein [Hyphomicrobium sp.]